MLHRSFHIGRLVGNKFPLFGVHFCFFLRYATSALVSLLNLPIPRPRAVSLPMRVLLSDFTGRSTSKNSHFSLIPGSGKQAHTELVVRES